MDSNDSMLRDLHDKLQDMSRDELLAVVDFVDRLLAKRSASGTEVLPWDEFDRAHGVIALGGDALEDCAGLYDDE